MRQVHNSKVRMSTILNQDLDFLVICKADKKTMIEIGLNTLEFKTTPFTLVRRET